MSLTNFVGNLGHCGCLSVILIWNGGVVWPESELQRDRMLGREALNRNMCLRKKAVFPLAEALSVDQPEEPAWRAAFPAGMNLWLGLYWFCYVAWTKLPRHDKNTWQQRKEHLNGDEQYCRRQHINWAEPSLDKKLFLGLSPETHDLKFRQTPTLLM